MQLCLLNFGLNFDQKLMTSFVYLWQENDDNDLLLLFPVVVGCWLELSIRSDWQPFRASHFGASLKRLSCDEKREYLATPNVPHSMAQS